MAEVKRKPRHLRIIGVADEKRGAAAEQSHGDDDAMSGDIAHRRHDIRKAAHGAPQRCRSLAKPRPIGRVHQPQDERQVEHGVDEDAERRAERQQERAAHGRSDQHAEIARRRVKAHGARQIGGADDVVQQDLAWRLPQHAGAAVNDQQHHGVPHLQSIGDEEIAPAQGGDDEQRHAALDDAAGVEPIGERAGRDRKGEERQPVRNHGETRQRRGFEFAEHHPIADDVLDVVRHHRQHIGDELRAVAAVTQRRKGLLCRRGRGCGLLRVHLQIHLRVRFPPATRRTRNTATISCRLHGFAPSASARARSKPVRS